MTLTWFDWSIVFGTLGLTLIVGLWVSKRAGRDSASFFLGNRHMPWWLLGFSMVATTFAADTPNLVTQIVRTQGVSGNWIWWCFLLTGMLTTFVYARLWRRLGVTTDIEFYERRYSGKPAGFLRGFRAVYLGLFFNVMIMANVTLAAVKISSVLFAVEPETVIVVAGLITVVFSAAGGFVGVLITDFLLFFLAMTGSILAAYFALDHPAVGGLSGLLEHPALQGKISFLPDLSDPNQYVPLLLIPLLVQWWSVWYPGAEPGGGGYIAQRMLAAKNENHSVGASAFFNLCHYAIRPWPWIIVALASLVIYPDIASLRAALPNVPANIIADDLAYSAMLAYVPAGALGIVIASLAAAYVSTISTSLNWGASYLVNDVYKRFAAPDATDKQMVTVGRIFTVLLMLLAGLLALKLESAMQAFRLMMSIGAGTGLLFLLRWFWHRINVWSEISAMVLSFSISMYFEFGAFSYLAGWQKLTYSVALTTLGWVVVTLLTPPADSDTLQKFDNSIRADKGSLRTGAMATLAATIGVYAALFCVGALLFGRYELAAALLLTLVVSGVMTRKLYWQGSV